MLCYVWYVNFRAQWTNLCGLGGTYVYGHTPTHGGCVILVRALGQKCSAFLTKESTSTLKDLLLSWHIWNTLMKPRDSKINYIIFRTFFYLLGSITECNFLYLYISSFSTAKCTLLKGLAQHGGKKLLRMIRQPWNQLILYV